MDQAGSAHSGSNAGYGDVVRLGEVPGRHWTVFARDLPDQGMVVKHGREAPHGRRWSISRRSFRKTHRRGGFRSNEARPLLRLLALDDQNTDSSLGEFVVSPGDVA